VDFVHDSFVSKYVCTENRTALEMLKK